MAQAEVLKARAWTTRDPEQRLLTSVATSMVSYAYSCSREGNYKLQEMKKIRQRRHARKKTHYKIVCKKKNRAQKRYLAR